MKYITIQQLLESTSGGTLEEQVDEAAQWITRNAQPWLTAVDHNIMEHKLFRGSYARQHSESYEDTDNWTVRNVRTNRTPRGMNETQMATWEKYISDAGMIANRRNSWMTTGNHADTLRFGSTNIVIPMGEFNYTWVDGIGDANDWYWSEIQSMEGRVLDHVQMERFYDGEFEFDIKGDDNSLIEAISSGAEIMLHPTSQKAALFDPRFIRDVVAHMRDDK